MTQEARGEWAAEPETVGPLDRVTATVSMARVALEAVATASWLMSPGPIDTRIKRSIQQAWHERDRVAIFTKQATVSSTDVTALVQDALFLVAAKRPGTKNLTLDNMRRRPSITELVKLLDGRAKTSGLPPSQAWRVGSGVSHSTGAFLGTIVVERGDGEEPDAINPVLALLVLLPTIESFEAVLRSAEKFMQPTAGRTNPTASAR